MESHLKFSYPIKAALEGHEVLVENRRGACRVCRYLARKESHNHTSRL